MLTHPRPPLSPDLATAVNADAAQDEPRRKWWSRLAAAHLECVSDVRKDCNSIEIEAREGAIFTISTDGMGMIVLRHALADLPAGRCTIRAEDARRYISSRGWAPLSATADHNTFPDARKVGAPPSRPWSDLAHSSSPLGMDARLLALPAQVARRLGVRHVIRARLLASGALAPVHITAKIGSFDASFIVMPGYLNE